MDDYEDLRTEFSLFPGIDLGLWLKLVSALAVLAAFLIAVFVAM